MRDGAQMSLSWKLKVPPKSSVAFTSSTSYSPLVGLNIGEPILLTFVQFSGSEPISKNTKKLLEILHCTPSWISNKFGQMMTDPLLLSLPSLKIQKSRPKFWNLILKTDFLSLYLTLMLKFLNLNIFVHFLYI